MLSFKEILERDLNKLRSDIIRTLASYGSPITSTQDKIRVFVTPLGGWISVPFWFSVYQDGRRPRKNTEDHELWKIIFKWMEKHNLFKTKNKKTEAKQMTWFINKYGTKLFRDGKFRNIYSSLVIEFKEMFIEEIKLKIGQDIRSDLVKLSA